MDNLFLNDFHKNFKDTTSRQPSPNINSNLNLLNSIRRDIMSELDAVNQYSDTIAESNNSSLNKVLQDIKSEEETHIGELFYLLFNLSPDAKTNFDKGMNEAKSLN